MGGQSPATVELSTPEGSDALARLRYPTPPRRSHPSTPARLAAFGLLAAAALFTGSLIIEELLSVTPRADRWLFVSFWGFACVLSAGLAVIALRLRAFRVQNGVMTLVMPKRTFSGRRIRRVALADIVHAERITQPGADPGILVTLRDGTSFPVFDGDVPDNGGAFLDRLVAAIDERRRTLPPERETR
jgi:hypothetical protein